jgi:hypothetical protein
MASRKIRLAAVSIVLGAVAVLVAGQSGEASKPLVRKDLLVFGKVAITPPVRDIFRPRATAWAPAPVLRPAGPAAAPAAGTPVPEAAPSFSLNISYIGSIKSGGQTIALILRGGQTLSVKEGDEIVPGYKVISLSAESIVVQGPTGETRTFPRQGDRP